MSGYRQDRTFTDYIHQNLTIPTIYPKLGWQVAEIDAQMLCKIDMNDGIDAVILDHEGEQKTVQYRYRDHYYQQYNDVTLRYERPHNAHADRRRSEFHKIKADYLLYGIANGKKFLDALDSNTDFVKWVVIDLSKLRQLFKRGDLIIDANMGGNHCEIKDGKLVCPIVNNHDNSSNFVPFHVLKLQQLFPNDCVIVAAFCYPFISHS